MKKVSLGIVALAWLTAVSLSAQATPPPSSDQTAGTSGTSASQKSSDQKVTVSGCLERGKEAGAAAGTSGTAGTAGAGASASASAESAKFVLNNVTGSPASATGTSGAAAGAAPTASSYRLDGDDAKLAPHVGHKIEVTGTVDKSATGASMSASAPKLKVDSVKMIASSCTP